MKAKAELVGYVLLFAFVALLAVGDMAALGYGDSGGSSGGNGGPSGGGHVQTLLPGSAPASAGCSAPPTLPDPDLYSDAGDAVKALSRATSSFLKTCACPARTCLADALDNYAQALAKVEPRLPPQFRDLSRVVAQAAHRVRAAHSKAEAEAALADAISHVHKEIELIRVTDVDKQDRLTRSGDFVAGTLATAKDSLLRADAI